jgi:hypothetical protein
MKIHKTSKIPSKFKLSKEDIYYLEEKEMESNKLGEIMNGLYISSNVELHKFRDYDPKLKNHIKLKQ